MPDQSGKPLQVQAKDPAVLAEVQRDLDEAIAQKINRTPTVILSRGPKRYAFSRA